MLNNEVRKTGMDDLFTRFFFALYQFHKLHMGDLVPDITKLEGMTMAAIKHCSGEKEELTVSKLTAKLKAKGFDAIVTTNGGSAAGSANSEIKVGDVVQFSGGPHYGSAAASTAAGTPKAGPAKVTRIVKGAKHPYHIVHTDNQSNVYGWVDAANVSK